MLLKLAQHLLTNVCVCGWVGVQVLLELAQHLLTLGNFNGAKTYFRYACQESPIKEPYYTQTRPTDIGIPQVCMSREKSETGTKEETETETETEGGKERKRDRQR